MFKLPDCPYCRTVYRYGDVKKIKKKSEEKCYHCKKIFKISKLGYIVLGAIIAAAAIIINILILSSMSDIFSSLIPIIIISIIAVILILLLTPYFIKFRK